ncbi:TetR/AcrR family transcriptional regulator [Ferrimonas sediminicola]|uniref:TetR/AcrR family transcriptional regulator n=1 Tax=Ferrimonas sediminicola TaxID=2569538 RepID=A0A4U1BK77_9GAMM|nr:TetR/AcrR family transcriptional regulator [Ferrimonas sediminicola]TKB51605.1 TetR/AcrR family transcriptional regulator [Ferrimonas sediminicola]
MGVVANDRKSKKRCQILEAATELFMQKGLENTSMDEVAVRAGVSKQTVYSHFGSKNDLFVHCIEARCVSAQMTEESFDMDADPGQVILQFARRFLEMILSPEVRHVYCSCIRCVDSHPELSQLYYDAGPKRMMALVSGYLERLSEAGVLAVPNPVFAGQQLLLMLHTVDKMRGELGLGMKMDEEQREAYVEQTVTMFLKGYRP